MLTHLIPRHIDVEALAFPFPSEGVVSVLQPRVEVAIVVAVDGEIQHTWVIVEHVLSGLTMVHIPVHYKHSSMSRERGERGKGRTRGKERR